MPQLLQVFWRISNNAEMECAIPKIRITMDCIGVTFQEPIVPDGPGFFLARRAGILVTIQCPSNIPGPSDQHLCSNHWQGCSPGPAGRHLCNNPMPKKIYPAHRAGIFVAIQCPSRSTRPIGPVYIFNQCPPLAF
jgi:hypothetical protein